MTRARSPVSSERSLTSSTDACFSFDSAMTWRAMARPAEILVPPEKLMDKAIDRVIRERKSLTKDLGGTASTSQMGDAIAAAV